MQLVAVDTPCILLVSYSSAVFCFSYGYGSLYNPSPLLRVLDRCNTFSDKIFHIPTYPRTLPSGRCRYIPDTRILTGILPFLLPSLKYHNNYFYKNNKGKPNGLPKNKTLWLQPPSQP